jgi:ABC-type nitrate/sulfonate/bicarbonate transport system substrate-binding protein
MKLRNAILSVFAIWFLAFACQKNATLPDQPSAKPTPVIAIGHAMHDLRALPTIETARRINAGNLGFTLKIVKYESQGQIHADLTSRKLDLALVDPVNALLAKATQEHPFVFIGGAVRGGLTFAVRKAETSKPSELIGEAVGLAEPGTAEQFFLHSYFMANKLDGRVYTPTIGQAEAAHALKQHTVDGYPAFDPLATELLSDEEAGILAESKTVAPRQLTAVYVASTPLKAREKIAMVLESCTAVTQDKNALATLAAQEFELDDASAGKALSRIEYSTAIDAADLAKIARFLDSTKQAPIADPAAFVEGLLDKPTPKEIPAGLE